MLTLALLSSPAFSAPLATKGDLLFSDDFERAELGEAWRISIPAFVIEKGVLKGSQTRDDHGSVGGFKLPQQNVVLEFKFRLEGSKSFNAVFDDRGYKGSHAGHICRVVVGPKDIRLGDDKEGIMRNDIFEMRRDPKRKAESDKLLVGRGAASPAKVDQGHWYQFRIELVGDTLAASLDGHEVCRLKSAGIGHPTKTDFHFTVSGKDAWFDDIRLYAARAAAPN